MDGIWFGEYTYRPRLTILSSSRWIGVIANTWHSASQDILRIYDLNQSETSRHRAVPFTIIPGHRGGVISAVHVDPACRYMLSAAGNRGSESTAGTEVLLGYEIGVQDPNGVWQK